MANTLKASKIKLEQDLKQAFKDAAYEAYMTQYAPNQVSQASNYDSDNKKAMEDKANEFADTLSKELAGDLATAIYDFVKEIGIQINTVPPSVIAPSGPCTGTIPMTSFTIL